MKQEIIDDLELDVSDYRLAGNNDNELKAFIPDDASEPLPNVRYEKVCQIASLGKSVREIVAEVYPEHLTLKAPTKHVKLILKVCNARVTYLHQQLNRSLQSEAVADRFEVASIYTEILREECNEVRDRLKAGKQLAELAGYDVVQDQTVKHEISLTGLLREIESSQHKVIDVSPLALECEEKG